MSYGNLGGGYVVRLKAAELAGLRLNISSGAADSLYLNGGTSPGCHFLYSDIDDNYSESNQRERRQALEPDNVQLNHSFTFTSS